MKVAIAVVVAVGSSCFVSPVMHFGGASEKEAQHTSLQKATPPGLVVDTEWTGDVTAAKIRVWADDDYRAQNVRWQQTFQEQLDYANEVLASQFGVRLVAEYHVWNHREPGATLMDALGVLAKQDSGDDVLAVVGLTSSLSLVSATFEQLGLANLPGRHLVVRGYADVEERRNFDLSFHELDKAERASFYQARRRHKTTAVLLHELAHNLGSPHRVEADTIMSALYSDRSTSFDRASRDVIVATLGQRLHRAPPPSVRTSSPIASTAASRESHPTLEIGVDAAGQCIVGGNPIDDSTLDGLLHMSFEDDRDTIIVVKVSSKVAHGAVAKVIDHAKAAGLHRISITGGD